MKVIVITDRDMHTIPDTDEGTRYRLVLGARIDTKEGVAVIAGPTSDSDNSLVMSVLAACCTGPESRGWRAFRAEADTIDGEPGAYGEKEIFATTVTLEAEIDKEEMKAGAADFSKLDDGGLLETLLVATLRDMQLEDVLQDGASHCPCGCRCGKTPPRFAAGMEKEENGKPTTEGETK